MAVISSETFFFPDDILKHVESKISMKIFIFIFISYFEYIYICIYIQMRSRLLF